MIYFCLKEILEHNTFFFSLKIFTNIFTMKTKVYLKITLTLQKRVDNAFSELSLIPDKFSKEFKTHHNNNF